MLNIIYMLWCAMEADIASGKISSIAELELEYGIFGVAIVRNHAVECDIVESVAHYIRTDENGHLYLCTDVPGEIKLEEEIEEMFAQQQEAMEAEWAIIEDEYMDGNDSGEWLEERGEFPWETM